MMDEYMEIAIVNDNVKLLRELLAEKPERLEQRERYGRTPLMLAVTTERRSLNCINALLDHGADVNARNPGGYTALHLVVWNEYFPPESATSEEIIGVLLDAGALLEDDQNDRAWTPLLAAVCEDCCGDARVLLERGANPNRLVSPSTSLTTIAGLSLLSLAWLEPDMMQVLIEGGADVQLRNAFGQTVLEWIQEQDAGDFEEEKQRGLELLRRVQQAKE